MKTDVFPEKKAAMVNDPLPLEIDQAEIALRQADVARLFGITRQRVSQLVSRGQLTTRPDGKINPSTAAAELLKSDAPQARSKILVAIRRQIDEATARADQAQATARDANACLAVQRERITALVREVLEANHRLDVMVEELEAALGESADELIYDAMDAAFRRARAASDAELFAALSDDNLVPLIAALRPGKAKA